MPENFQLTEQQLSAYHAFTNNFNDKFGLITYRKGYDTFKLKSYLFNWFKLEEETQIKYISILSPDIEERPSCIPFALVPRDDVYKALTKGYKRVPVEIYFSEESSTNQKAIMETILHNQISYQLFIDSSTNELYSREVAYYSPIGTTDTMQITIASL